MSYRIEIMFEGGFMKQHYHKEEPVESMKKQETKYIDLSKNKFKKASSKVVRENDDVLRRLADK